MIPGDNAAYQMIPGVTSPAGIPKKRVWGPWSTFGLGLATGAIFLIVQSVVVAAFVIARLAQDADIDIAQLTSELVNDGDLLAAATIASAFACIGFILLMVKARRGETITQYLAMKPINKKTVIVMVAITIGFIAISSGINFILKRPIDSDYMNTAYNNTRFPYLLWVATVIFAPVFEEAFLRGFMFIGFRQSWLGPLGATILTALIWALLHIQYAIFEMTLIFFLGIILGVVRHKTGSLWSPLIIHSLNNLLAMIMVALY